MIITYQTVEVKHLWQVYVTSELKIKLFYVFTVCTMVWIFIAVKNKYLNLSTVLRLLTIQNEPKRDKTKSTSSNSNFRPIFPYCVQIQAGFDNPFIGKRVFIYLGILEMS